MCLSIRTSDLEEQQTQKRRRTEKAEQSMEVIEYDESNDIDDSDFLDEPTEQPQTLKDDLDSQIELSHSIYLGLGL